MIALPAAVVLAALAGSVHCAAMCGPLAAAAIGEGPGKLHAGATYAAGRLVAYTLLGVIAGLVGAGVDLVGSLLPFARLALVASGLAMVTWGGWSLVRALGWLPASPRRPSTRLYAIRKRRPALRGALFGLLTAALPCGWLYTFVAIAAATGAPGAGALVMVAAWLGTTPATVGGGAVLRIGRRLLGARAPVVVAVLQLAVGVLIVAARVPIATHGPAALHDAMDVPGAPTCH